MINRLLRHRKTLIFAFLAAVLCLILTVMASIDAVGNFLAWISAPLAETAYRQTVESIILTNTGVTVNMYTETAKPWTPTMQTPR
jgi:hypothetical protein